MNKMIMLFIATLLFVKVQAQNVGIGTTTPSKTLDVSGKVGIYSGLNGDPTVRGLPGTGWTRVGGASGLGFWANDSVEYNNTPHLLINYNGSVGIGTSSPNSGYKLDVNGDALVNGLTLGKGSGDPGFTTRNTAAGNAALFSNTFGDGNTAIGYQSLYSNITGYNNTATGEYTLYSNTGGTTNISIGSYALYSNTNGSGNIANGYSALYSNTTGADNTAIGGNSLFSNTTGRSNLAVGGGGLYYNTTGAYNVGIGTVALYFNETGSSNIAVGYQSLYSNISGNLNTATGYQSLTSNSTGNNNTANGYQSLFSNTEGSYNTATGDSSLYSNTTGIYSTANGSRALFSSTTGTRNTATGYEALFSNTTGSINTANGVGSLYSNTTGVGNSAHGQNSLPANSTGSRNTAVGYSSLFSNTTGSWNTAVGYNADISDGTFTNATAIGARAYAGGSNTLVLGSVAGVNGASDNVKVGIGTTTPQDELEVVGNIRFRNAGDNNWALRTSEGTSLVIRNNNGFPDLGATRNIAVFGNNGDVFLGPSTDILGSGAVFSMDGASGRIQIDGQYNSTRTSLSFRSYPLWVKAKNNGILISIQPDDNNLGEDNNYISFIGAVEPSGTFSNTIYGAIEGFNPNEFDFSSMSLCELNEFFGPIPSDPLGAITWGINIESQLACMLLSGRGVTYKSGAGDYAECLEKADPNEKMIFGDIVGVKGGKISRNTEGAEQVMSISLAPIVLGKIVPHDSLNYKYEKVGFMGQVPVKVRGKVKSGDYIVASGLNDGCGYAVPEKSITLDIISKIVGRSWDNSDNEGLKFINVLIGVKGNELNAILAAQQQKMNKLETDHAEMKTSHQEKFKSLEAKIEFLMNQIPPVNK